MLISGPKKHFGGIAQLVERLVRNEKARGSNPLTSSFPASAKMTITAATIGDAANAKNSLT